ncbi:ABC-2 type transport system ATP-binding protein [Nocardiopsis sp. Huas11]|uniref:ATP-binding cassette domain-containing protein n=1 Tax=Nocardiopsis sp. Huas11 TaxID=2183912 RepID=UPI000EAF3F39|nr:ATP-binding cassette domain-containing protein [Nocardiopsis sp. Huas11]RKS06837.1 ABC-2 type transport system ATP-binding protein [Nocardiopsis sp. Huas11]
MTHTPAAISARGVGKRYGRSWALRGFDLDVAAGSVHGLLGPNGAGKTTAVRILTTLLRADEGTVRVAGYDVAAEAAQVRYRIGLVGQHAAVDEVLSGRQNLEMFGRLYHLGTRPARRRAEELLERFGLQDTGTKPVSGYSGGMRRRLDLAASLILSPPVLFLDEPTVGLDPRGRGEVWSAVRRLVADGTTVLLTTQYLEEADQLADEVSVIDAGRVIAEGGPEQLKGRLGGDRIDVVLDDAGRLAESVRLVEELVGGPVVVGDGERPPGRRPAPGQSAEEEDTAADHSASHPTLTFGVGAADRVSALTGVVRALEEKGVGVADVALRRPTLDEVFLHLTGDREDETEEAAHR